MNSRDYQRSKVYSWEEQFPKGRFILFDAIPAYVACIWNAQGLKWPPLVEKLAPQDKTSLGKANRGHVCFKALGAYELVILHELAHAMTATHDGYIDAHGPSFVGVYMCLLCHHLNIPLSLLMYSATKAKLDFDIHAKPWCGK